MRVRLTNLHLYEGEPEESAELETGELVVVNPIGRRRRRVIELSPGEKRVRATLVIVEENGYADDCGSDFEFWLDELPRGSVLGSEFDLTANPVQ